VESTSWGRPYRDVVRAPYTGNIRCRWRSCAYTNQSSAYEAVWHLVIPPIMALLDDYEARYKLLGVQITSAMLERVPSTVLKRTGVDSLLFAVRPLFK
jgi:hypothetical protein